jgi:hypothetical protein
MQVMFSTPIALKFPSIALVRQTASCGIPLAFQ